MEEKKRLIVIDDETALLEILKEFLQGFGLEVFAYEFVPDLESELRERRPHAVLLDILMPVVSGIELLTRIKKIDEQLPVIMMTGYADEAKRVEVLRKGAYALLTKPFKSFEELYHTINNAMSHYIASMQMQALTVEIKERYEREKLNIIELNFLKSLQQMIGETEETSFVLRSAYTLLKEFLDFRYFGSLLLGEGSLDVEVYHDGAGDLRLIESVAGVLIGNLPDSEKVRIETVTVQGRPATIGSPIVDPVLSCTMVELSAAGRIYGYAGLFRYHEFTVDEVHLLERFCAHITVTLEKIRLFHEVRVLSIRDGLTGVYNHAHSMGMLEAEIGRAERYGTPFSLIMADIDDFKRINDTYGHLAGDYVLQNVSRLLEMSLRTIDLVGRYGGEEFIVILPETNAEQAGLTGERVRKAIESGGFIHEGRKIELTISVGVATYQTGMDLPAVIKIADDNLYKAKKRGKNRVCYE